MRTFLFNWLFARQQGGECLLRIENTDTGREVAESVEQIQESLRWLGIDWDGPVTFQLDRMDEVRTYADRLLAEGKAYEDEGAIRFRMPDEGVVGWDDAVRGRIEFQNENLADLVIVRSDGRPTYNFASPVEDMLDGITHVIRGNDHVSNTPTQINILRALGAELPVYAHVPDVLGNDGKKLSKRHGAVSVDVFRADGYLPAGADELPGAARLELRRQDDRDAPPRADRALLARARRPEPGDVRLREARLAERRLPARRCRPTSTRSTSLRWLREQGIDWPEETVRATVPLVQEKIEKFSQYPDFVRFLFEPVSPNGADPDTCRAALAALEAVEPWEASRIEEALRALAEQLGQKPREAFGPIRLAVTGSKVSPGLFESLELLGKERVARAARRGGRSAAGGAAAASAPQRVEAR